MLAIPFSAVASTEEGRSSAVGLASGGISPVEATVADDGAASVSAMTSDQRGRACSPAVRRSTEVGRGGDGSGFTRRGWAETAGVTDRDHSLPQEQRCLVEVRSHTQLTVPDGGLAVTFIEL